ncbi:MAG TPA: alpha/beta hydrolase [Terrimicrobiaceae bacterium]
MNFWKRKPALGIGIGVSLVGALALAVRYGFRRAPRERIPDDISPAIFATRVTETAFGEMIYHISGSGDPVVFLHGIYLGASSYEWSKVYPHFTMGKEVIVPDLIGFGESERPETTMDATDYAESLAEFLRSTCAQRSPVIVASGLTAGIALLLASRHPELIGQLILLLPTGLKESGTWGASGVVALVGLPGLNRFVYRNYLSRAPFIRGWLTKYALGNPSQVNEEMVRALTTCAQQAGAEHAIFGFLRGRLAFDVESRLDSVPHRVSVLWPDRASGFPLSAGEAISRKLQRGKLVQVPECGILAALEVPAVLTSIIASELDGDFRLEGAA